MINAGKYSPSCQKHWFQRLDQWDLDDVLQNVAGDGLSLQQCASVVPAKTHEGK